MSPGGDEGRASYAELPAPASRAPPASRVPVPLQVDLIRRTPTTPSCLPTWVPMTRASTAPNSLKK